MRNKVGDVNIFGERKVVRKTLIILPNSFFYKLWEGVVAITCFLSTIIAPFQLSFKADIPTLTATLYAFDLIYVIHIVTKFYVPYLHEGDYITDYKKIKRRYARGEFIVDILSVFPIELISLAARGTTNNWQYLIRIERINRVLRCYFVIDYIAVYEDHLRLATKIIQSAKYTVIAYTLMHFITCGWYMLACPNESAPLFTFQCYPDSWAVVHHQNMESLSTFQRYLKCFYWATITSTSTGYGDITAVNSQEKWFSIIVMIIGIGFFSGRLLGYMASTITNADSKRAKYTHRITVIRAHLADKSVSQEIQKKVTGYYEHLWNRQQGVVKHGIFSELPITTQAEISLVVNKHVLERASLFSNLSSEIARMISLVIKPVTYLPQQIIFNRNDIQHSLFYIIKGSAEVLSPDSNSPKTLKLLKQGSVVGEIALLLNMPRAATVRAAAFCEVLMLDRADLTKVLHHFPSIAHQLYEVISKRCQIATQQVKEMRNSVDYTERSFSMKEPSASSTDHVETEKESKFIILGDKSFIIPPSSLFLLIWKVSLIFVVIIFSLAHTYVISYLTSFGRTAYGNSDELKYLFAFLYIIDILYLVDIIIYTRTAIKDENESLIEDPKLILYSYARSYSFWLDLISVIPLELFCFAFSNSENRWLAASFLRSNRILKIYKVFVMLTQLESDITRNIGNVRIFKLGFLICTTTHLCACLWFFHACFGDICASGSWATHAAITKSTSISEIYIKTLYWSAATMTSTGYGDIHAHRSEGEVIVTITFFTGLLLYGYCLSNIAATLTNKLYPKVQFMGRINAVISFILEQKLSVTLIGRVEKYLGLLWRIHRGEAIPGSQLLMGDMPKRLQQEVSFEEMQEIISKVPIFTNTDESFVKLVASKLITYVFMPNDMVVYRGDVGREMYIIRRGLVEVLSSDQSYVVVTLGPGGFFGEVGLIFGKSRTADVRTKTYCEVAMLRKSDLDEVLKIFPLIDQQFRLTGKNEHILEKITNAAKNAGIREKKVARIDLIEQTKLRRSRSIFHRKNSQIKLSLEELDIDELLKGEFRQPYATLSPIPYFFSHFLMRKVFDPNNLFFRVWTAVSVTISCIYIVTTGLQISFLPHNSYIIAINYLIDFYFLVDIYIKFHVGFYSADGILITHPTATASHYLKTNFILDFLAFIPIDIFMLGLFNANGYYFSKMNHILHIVRVGQYFNYLEEPISGKTAIYQSIKFTSYTYIMIHVFACAWFKLGCSASLTEAPFTDLNDNEIFWNCNPNSWALQQGRNLSVESPMHQYITSLYWAAATACSVGYGDIHAFLIPEMTLSLICMVSGVVFFGFIIASVTASLANADAQRARFQEKLNTINRFLVEQNVEATLRKRIQKFYKFLWNRNKGVHLEKLFEGLPTALQADITLSLYKDMIESVPLFKDTELSFTKMLSLYIQPLLLPKGEYIVRKGDMGEEMFFIHKGVVEVVSEHEIPIVFDTMSFGRFFGEISTIFSCPRTASVRTQTNTDLFVLKKKDLDMVLGHYPHIRKKIIETAEERQKMVQERAAAAAAKKAAEDRKTQMMVINKMRRQSLFKEARLSIDFIKKGSVIISEELIVLTESELAILKMSFCDNIGLKIKLLWEWVTTKMGFVIGIESRFHAWRKLNCLLIVLSFVSTTYMAFFQHYLLSLVVFNITAEVSFYFEIFLKFHIVYLNTAGDEVISSHAILKHYVKGELAFDVIANFPLWLIAFFLPDDNLKYFAYFSLLQVIRLKRLRDYFKMWLSKLDINVLVIRLIENVAQIIIQLQISSCFWYVIACQGNVCGKVSWVNKRQIEDGVTLTPIQKYTDSVYWALATMTSTGFGDIHATNNQEKLFAALVMVLGKVLFGFVLGNIASTMANMEALRVLFEERFSAVLAHMKDQRMPASLQQRVVNFFQYIWRRNKGSTNNDIFDLLHSCLHAELCLDLAGKQMQEVPIFKNCELPFIRLLCVKTKLLQFHEFEYIYQKGDIGNEMYFIKRGTVELMRGEQTEMLSQSKFFGDDSLASNTPRMDSAKAVTHTDMFSLSNAALKNAFASYPQEEFRVRNNIERLMNDE